MLHLDRVRTPAQLKQFIDFPYRLYRGNACWVPPLRRHEWETLQPAFNPAFAHSEAAFWLAREEGRIVGRVAGIVNRRYNEEQGEQSARFGWLDFVDDREVSAALFSTLENWARGQGMLKLHGPLGFCDLDRQGLLVEGFDEPGTLYTQYNHPYYGPHLEALGYRKEADWVEYSLTGASGDFRRVGEIARETCRFWRLSLPRPRNFSEMQPYVGDFFRVFNESYRGLYGFASLSEAQQEFFNQRFLRWIHPDYACVVADRSGRLVAIGLGMPSLTVALQRSRGRFLPFGWWHLWRALRRNDRVDLLLVGVLPEWQGRGLNAVLMWEITLACHRNGVVQVETGPELECNRKVQAMWRHYGARPHKRRRCLVKCL